MRIIIPNLQGYNETFYMYSKTCICEVCKWPYMKHSLEHSRWVFGDSFICSVNTECLLLVTDTYDSDYDLEKPQTLEFSLIDVCNLEKDEKQGNTFLFK